MLFGFNCKLVTEITSINSLIVSHLSLCLLCLIPFCQRSLCCVSSLEAGGPPYAWVAHFLISLIFALALTFMLQCLDVLISNIRFLPLVGPKVVGLC